MYNNRFVSWDSSPFHRMQGHSRTRCGLRVGYAPIYLSYAVLASRCPRCEESLYGEQLCDTVLPGAIARLPLYIICAIALCLVLWTAPFATWLLPAALVVLLALLLA